MNKKKKEVGIMRLYRGQLFIFGEQTIEYVPPKSLSKDFPFKRVRPNA